MHKLPFQKKSSGRSALFTKCGAARGGNDDDNGFPPSDTLSDAPPLAAELLRQWSSGSANVSSEPGIVLDAAADEEGEEDDWGPFGDAAFHSRAEQHGAPPVMIVGQQDSQDSVQSILSKGSAGGIPGGSVGEGGQSKSPKKVLSFGGKEIEVIPGPLAGNRLEESGGPIGAGKGVPLVAPSSGGPVRFPSTEGTAPSSPSGPDIDRTALVVGAAEPESSFATTPSSMISVAPEPATSDGMSVLSLTEVRATITEFDADHQKWQLEQRREAREATKAAVVEKLREAKIVKGQSAIKGRRSAAGEQSPT